MGVGIGIGVGGVLLVVAVLALLYACAKRTRRERPSSSHARREDKHAGQYASGLDATAAAISFVSQTTGGAGDPHPPVLTDHQIEMQYAASYNSADLVGEVKI